jgi:alkylhydroperoxidase family enzyme
MRLEVPRIPPLAESEWTAEVKAVLPRSPGGAVRSLNIFTTLARHPALLERWLVFANHVLAHSTLPARERELVILRTGWLCRSAYEFHQHTRLGKACGLSSEEIEKIKGDADAWTGRDAALVRAADELHADQMIGDATWEALRADWSEQQLLDLLFAIGQYTLVSMVLNSLGVQIEGQASGSAP